MRVRRILLTDVAGVRHAELILPEAGVSVVYAPNESGKSTLLKAFGSALSFKSSSKDKDILGMQPVGQDVGPMVEIEVEIAGNPIRMTKRFVRDKTTEVTIGDGAAARQLTGDEGHEAVRALFRDHVDTELYDFLTFKQGRGFDPIETGKSDVVKHALGRVSSPGIGDAGAAGVTGGRSGVLELVEAFAEGFHDRRNGKPKGDFRKVNEKVEQARAARDEQQRQLDQVEAAAISLVEIDARLATIESEQQRLDAARLLAELREKVATVTATLEAARQIVQVREGLLADVESATRTRDAAATAVEDLEGADGLATDAAGQTDTHVASVERATSEHASELDVLAAAQLNIASALAARLAAIDLALAASPEVTPQLLAEARQYRREMELQEAALEGGAWELEIEAAGEIRLEVDEAASTLATGASFRGAAKHHVEVTTADGTAVRMRAGGDAAERSKDLDTAKAELGALLQRVSAGDLTEMDAMQARRAVFSRTRQALYEALTPLVRGEQSDVPDGDPSAAPTDYAERVAIGAMIADPMLDGVALSPRAGDLPEDAELRGLFEATELGGDRVEAAATALADARGAAEVARITQEASAGRVQDRKQQFSNAENHFTAAIEKLRSARSERADEELTDDVLAKEQALAEANNSVKAALDTSSTALQAGSVDDGPDGSSVAAIDARRIVLDAEKLSLREVRGGAVTQAERAATLRSALGTAQERLEADLAELAMLSRDAAASRALLLRLLAARSELADLHREPMRQRISEGLGRLYDHECDVRLDDELVVTARTERDGTWIEWDQLSGGAREQLAIVTGLAMAELAGTDGVPFWLDDAIVHTDETRLTSLAALLLDTSAQVIVLTCRPEFADLLPQATYTVTRRGDVEATL